MVIKMSHVSEGYINDVIDKVAEHLHIEKWECSVNKFDEIAQNYFGNIVPIHLVCETDPEINYWMVLKLAPTDERFRVSGAVTLMFLREIFVYIKLLKVYDEIQQDVPQDLKYITSKRYYTCSEYGKEVIAIEDMTKDGYKPYVHCRFLDLNHIVLAVKALAKFHALSFILKETNANLFEYVKENCKPLTLASNKRYMDILNDRLSKAIKVFENAKYVHFLEEVKQNYITLVESAFTHAKETCICHGDIWKENILFKYCDNIPISACIIDYQTVRMCSPAFDLLYLITSSTDSDLRRKHYHQILDVYYETFDKMLDQGKVESRVYTRAMLDIDLKTVAPCCFIVANTALWLSSGLQQEGHVRSKIVLSTEQSRRNAENEYRAIIAQIIDDYNKLGYINV